MTKKSSFIPNTILRGNIIVTNIKNKKKNNQDVSKGTYCNYNKTEYFTKNCIKAKKLAIF